MRIVAIDPGIDITGLAALEYQEDATFDQAVGALVATGEATTSASDDMPSRLASLALQVRAFLVEHDPAVVVVEVPSFHGNYSHRNNRKSVNKLYQSLGAILAQTGSRTLCVPAPKSPKATRHQLLEYAAKVADVSLPRGRRGAKREDAWDAVWIGAQAIATGELRAHVDTRPG